MARFIVHIGPHKTGTTTIQKALADNARQLHREKILYPHRWRDWLWGHHGLAKQLKSAAPLARRSLERAFSILRRLDATVVLSSENFEHLKTPHIRLLKELVAGSDVQFWFYARRWDRLIPSIWQERIKHGMRKSLPLFLAERFARINGDPTLNYSLVLDRFGEEFGHSAMSVVVYDNLLDAGDNIVEHFFREVLKTRFVPEKTEWRNRSMKAGDVELIRALNAIEFADSEAGPGMRQRFFKNRSGCQAQIVQLHEIMSRHAAMLRIDSGSEAFRRLQAGFLGKYGPNTVNAAAPDALFSSTGHTDVHYIDPWYLFESGVRALLLDIHSRI